MRLTGRTPMIYDAANCTMEPKAFPTSGILPKGPTQVPDATVPPLPRNVVD